MEILGLLLVWPALGAPDCPKIGAIRWDAWYGSQDNVGAAVESILGPERWHSRLPFCAKVLSPSKVAIECATQENMEREIEYARLARLDYWAFVMYAPDSPLSAALNLYLSSKKKKLVNFSLVVDASQLGERKGFGAVRDRIVSLMKEPTYQTVAGGRPLLFLGFLNDEYVMSRWSGDAGFRAALEDLRAAALGAGLANPYLVVMDASSRRAVEFRKRFGFDAVSSYAVQGNAIRAPYSQLAKEARRFWNAARSAGSKVLPIAMSGWDRRPRVQTPAPWESGRERPDAMERYYVLPSPSELADHIAEAIYWVWAHPGAAEANAIIVYAWNEHDEGGWLAPTLAEGEARVNAVGERVRAMCGGR